MRLQSPARSTRRGYEDLCFPDPANVKTGTCDDRIILALGYWNEWYQSSLFLSSKVDVKPLQYTLYEVVNKMDQQGTDHDALLRDLRKRLNENCMDFACLTEDNSERAVGDDKTESMKSGTDTSEDLDDLMEILPCVRKSFWKPIWKQERLLTEKSAV